MMAGVTLTLSRQCSRCPRNEQVPVSLDDAVKEAQKALKAPKALSVVVDGKELFSFESLCSTCRVVVTKYLDNAGKMQKHASSLRDHRVEVVEE